MASGAAVSVRPPQIAIVDYGIGNRRSVEKALAYVGAQPIVTGDHRAIAAADGIVLPGVGAFPPAIEALRRRGLDRVIAEQATAGRPLLGICLGMQLLFDHSTEGRSAAGLGLLSGVVRPLAAGALRLPHIGWNEVRFTRLTRLNAAVPERAAFYHVHSLAAVPADPSDVLGIADYGEPFVSAVARDTIFGVQFHPEKSSQAGLKLLAGFSALCDRVES